MKKLTAIALCAVFLLSVVVVGVFGMKNQPFKEIVYTTGLEFTKIELSTGEKADIKKVEDAEEGKELYRAIVWTNTKKLSETAPLTLLVDYKVLPADATNKDVEVQIVDKSNDKVSINENGKIEVTGGVSFELSYRRLDTSGSEIVYLQIFVKNKR